jgi:eukaryotic-like serine/threonine-protein kinase
MLEANGMSAQIGKYRDIVELGKGGMGDVFLTVALGPAGFNKLLVVKRLRHSLASDPDFLKMFLNEARLAARLNHPNIVHTYEVGFDGVSHYIAMEYLEGQSLQRLIRRASGGGGLTLEMQLRVLADALAGLHYAHELTDYDGTPLAIVHRDVSPANIFVLYDGQVKLVDFGIAKSANSAETKAGIFKGKIQYVSPEQYTGGPLDRRADIYSAGVVLWEAVTGRRMWKDAGDLTVMQRVSVGDVPLPSSVEPQVPARLEAICMKALAVVKEDRYPTAAALQADIEDFLHERGSRVSAREVGALTAATFADDRTHVKLLVEDQLRLVRDHPDPQSLIPTVMLQQHQPDTGTRPTVSSSSLFPAFAPPRKRRRNAAIAISGGFAAIVGGLVLWGSVPHKEETPRANPTPVSAQAAPSAPTAAPPQASPELPPVASTAPAAAAQIKLTVEADPENARILVDGALLPPNGQLVGFAKDNALHKVRAEAPGYRPKTEWVRFDSDDVTLQISLELAPKKGRKEKDGKDSAPQLAESANQFSAPTAAPGATPMHELESTVARRRSSAPAAPPLDTADPWKK